MARWGDVHPRVFVMGIGWADGLSGYGFFWLGMGCCGDQIDHDGYILLFLMRFGIAVRID
jgi:hypothetical protein